MSITLNLKPEVEAGLLAQAQAAGMPLERYVQRLVENEMSVEAKDAGGTETSGMVRENGLLVYRTGRPLPAHVIDDAVSRSRDERARYILSDLS